GIRDFHVTGVQTCALPISSKPSRQLTLRDVHRCCRSLCHCSSVHISLATPTRSTALGCGCSDAAERMVYTAATKLKSGEITLEPGCDLKIGDLCRSVAQVSTNPPFFAILAILSDGRNV